MSRQPAIRHGAIQAGPGPMSILRRWMGRGAVGCGLLLALPCVAQDAGACRTIQNEKARASCIEVGQVADPQRLRSGLTSVRSAVQPLSRDRAAAVTAHDLATAPHRYVGRELMMRSSGCRYLDVNRYMCTLPGQPSVRVDASVVMPASAQVTIETGAGCATRQADGGAACPASIQFTPSASRTAQDGTVVVTTPTVWVREIAPERPRGARRGADRARSARP